MKTIWFALVALVAAGVSQARPLTLEESAALTPPDPSWEFFGRFGVAIDGDFALVSGESFLQPGDTARLVAALLYRRLGDTWTYLGALGPIVPLADGIRPGLAMEGGVAMTLTDQPRIFERIGSTWIPAAISPEAANGLGGEDIAIDPPRILAPLAGCAQEGRVIRKAGDEWRYEGSLVGTGIQCGDDAPAQSHDLHGNLAISYLRGESGPPHLRLHYAMSGWGSVAIPATPTGAFPPAVAQSGYFSFFTDSRRFGTRVLYEPDIHGPRFVSPYGLQPADGHMQRDPWSTTSITRFRDLIAQRNWKHDNAAFVINVFALNNDNARTFEQVALLRARGNASLGERLDVDANQFIVSGYDGYAGENVVRIFEVPADLSLRYTEMHDFEIFGARAWWQVAPGSLFFDTQSGNNRVYRQPSTNGTPSSWLQYSSQPDQAIQAAIVLRTFSGTDRWVGLGTRRTDAGNYYYAALRTSGVVELNRMRNGVSTTLASALAPASLVIGKLVRLRLESIGTLHRVYVDDRLLCSAIDDTLSGGLAGIIMHRAAADYDNVMIGRAGRSTIYADDFYRGGPHEWRYEGGGWSRNGGGSRLMRQTDSSGYARLNVGARTADHVLQVRVRPLSFANPDNWVGLMLRYKDARHHSYLSLRGRGVISLWRRDDAGITQLETRALPVTPGAWYTIRAEVVLGKTHVYVNDVLQFSGGGFLGPNDFDTAEMKGGVGLITYKATAEFDDFLAYEP